MANKLRHVAVSVRHPEKTAKVLDSTDSGRKGARKDVTPSPTKAS
jgi:hypothetical protein